MTIEEFNKVIELCREYHNTQLTINWVENGGNVSNSVPIVINRACASLVNELVYLKYSLFIRDQGVHVQKF